MPQVKTLTHKDLIPYAARWLRKRHIAVVTEIASGAGESPDALGFTCSRSTLIECKATRADFRADKKKLWRCTEKDGVGKYRYYLAPPGVIPHDEVPPKWGLLELTPRGAVKVVVQPNRGDRSARTWFNRNAANEIAILVSCLRRVGQLCPGGVSVKAYTFETKNTTTLGVLRDREMRLDNVDGAGI